MAHSDASAPGSVAPPAHGDSFGCPGFALKHFSAQFSPIYGSGAGPGKSVGPVGSNLILNLMYF